MSTVINTNLASLYAQNNLSNAQNNLATSVMRLSSGLRINSAKDDAAGLAISQNMQGQINGINQSVRNLNDATNLLQVADTSLATIQDMLLRMKQLATQGFNGSMSSNQKSDLVDELKALKIEIDNTSNRAVFNGNSLLANKTGYDSTHATRSVALNTALTGAATAMVTAISTVGTKAQVYTFSDDGAGKITLTGADGIAGTATVSGAVGTQTLSFGNLGISLTLSNSNVSSTNVLIGKAFGDSTGSGAAALQLKVTGTSPSLVFSSGASTTEFLSIATINTTTDAAASNLGAAWQMTQLGTKIGATTAAAAIGSLTTV
jgi:flagellin